MSSIFISYAREDFKHAESIFNFLEDHGFRPWMDKKNLLPGQNWEHVLEITLKQADFILVIISSTSVSKRGFVQREFKRALDYWQERPESDIYVIPVKIDSCEVPPSLAKFHWIEYGAEDFENKIREAITIQNRNTQNKLSQKVNFETKHPISKIQAEKKKYRSGIKLAIILTILVLVSIGSSFLVFSNRSSNHLSKETPEKERIFYFLEDYFAKIDSYAQEGFFADTVKRFYLRSNLTPAQIMQIRKENDEFLNCKIRFQRDSLILTSEENGIRYWSFPARFTCFRKSKNKFEVANIIMEFGINSSIKITSVTEKILNYNFTREKPLF